MKKTLVLLTVAVCAALTLVSCDKNKGKTKDPLSATAWTAEIDDYQMVLKFELGTLATFYVGDKNLQRIGPVSNSAYTLTDDTKISFANLSGGIDVNHYRFKTGTLNGDYMTVTYERWTTVSGMESDHRQDNVTFKKK